MEKLLAATVDDDLSAVKALFRADPGLATRRIDKERLFESGIFHWIYMGDTALHLAAAGYRVEIVRLTQQSGATSTCKNENGSWSTPPPTAGWKTIQSRHRLQRAGAGAGASGDEIAFRLQIGWNRRQQSERRCF